MSKIQNFNINQAKIQAKELHKLLSKNNQLAVDRLKILPEYNNKSIEQIIEFKPSLSKCQNVIARESGFNCWNELDNEYFWQNLTTVDIERAVAKAPSISLFGVGIDEEYMGEYLTKKQRNIIFEQKRRELLDELEQFKTACRWLRHQKKIKTFNRKRGSYGLKHIVENWASVNKLKQTYIANGIFIAAAIHMGFEFRRRSRKSPSMIFNISNKISFVNETN